MTTDVKFFSSEMLGAPQISGAAGSLLSVIDACLVTGFGLKSVTSVTVASGVATVVLATGNFEKHQIVLMAGATPAGLNGEKRVLTVPGTNTCTFDATGVADGVATGTITAKVAPLGWLKAFTGTNLGAYKIDPTAHPDTTGCLVRIADTGTYAAGIVGYESMTDINTGVAPFPTSAQATLFVFRSDAVSTSSYRSWFLVGDSRFVYVGVHSYTNSVVNYGPAWFSFGEFKSKKSADPYRFLVSGNGASDTAGAGEVNSVAGTSNTAFAFVSRSFTGLGGGVALNTRTWPSAYGGSGGGGAPLVYPNGPDYGLYLSNAQVFEGLHYRGDWPGMKFLPQNVVRKICPDLKTAYFDTEVSGYEGKVVGFYPCAYTFTDWGVVAFDLTGPWEH